MGNDGKGRVWPPVLCKGLDWTCRRQEPRDDGTWDNRWIFQDLHLMELGVDWRQEDEFKRL